VINRLLDAGPRGFEGDLTTVKYVNLTGVSRATAFRDLAALVAADALGTAGAGKATRYFIKLPGWEPLAATGLGP
jgi:Fic family protein